MVLTLFSKWKTAAGTVIFVEKNLSPRISPCVSGSSPNFSCTDSCLCVLELQLNLSLCRCLNGIALFPRPLFVPRNLNGLDSQGLPTNSHAGALLTAHSTQTLTIDPAVLHVMPCMLITRTNMPINHTYRPCVLIVDV